MLNMGFVAISGCLILRFTAGNNVDTENMATVEINRNPSNASNFGQFMADLCTEKVYNV